MLVILISTSSNPFPTLVPQNWGRKKTSKKGVSFFCYLATTTTPFLPLSCEFKPLLGVGWALLRQSLAISIGGFVVSKKERRKEEEEKRWTAKKTSLSPSVQCMQSAREMWVKVERVGR